MAIPFEGQNGSSTGSGTGSGGGCGDGRDGRKDENNDRRKNGNGKPKDIDDEERTDQESNDVDNNTEEQQGAHGGGDLNPVQEEENGEDGIPFLPIPLPEVSVSPTSFQTATLYANFLQEELRQNGIEDPPPIILAGQENAPEIPEWTYAGRDLRRVSERLESSPERQMIRQKAEQIDIDTIDFDNFSALLGALFEGGITLERIVVLFTFCSDLVCRAWRKGARSKFATLIKWSMKYIMTNVAQWVQSNGGWATVIRTSIRESQVSFFCASLVALFTCVFLVTRN